MKNKLFLLSIVLILSLSVSRGITNESGGLAGLIFKSGFEQSLSYDIIYVRYPYIQGENVSMPSGETPYRLESGADLILLKPDGTELVLVDCTDCSVMDPYISFDGLTVYYSYNELLTSGSFRDPFTSWIYKIHLDGHPNFNNYAPIRLTFDDGFDSVKYQSNRDPNGDLKDKHDQGDWRAIRDIGPIPLADGRLLFTSNRAALTAFHPLTNATSESSIQQMFVMDDHDGSANTKELANIQLLESGNIHHVQHPMQLKDGRILFSTWQDAATKYFLNFRYAMTPLFTINPDGSNLQQFTEPHDHHKNVEHFVSQLSDGQVVWSQYYPRLRGFGILMRAPLDPAGPDFLRGWVDQRFTHEPFFRVSYREFDRKDTVTITPHTDPGDGPAPNGSGKYSMMSAVNNGGLLVAYSTGYSNNNGSRCLPNCEEIKSGIYLINNANGSEENFVLDPATDLIKIKDDPDYNELWPRPVLSYQAIYGQQAPDIINNLAVSAPDDTRLLPAEAAAIVGTSSMYNREYLNEGNPDSFSGSVSRETHGGNWTIQGAEAGVFDDSEIYAVRIIASPPIPFTEPISKGLDRPRWDGIERHLLDDRLRDVVARFGSNLGERWEILGEFPVKKSSVTDQQGNPDTSWLAKIPSDTPTFIQTIDAKGMTLVSEITWRALKSGEKRADCGGCHAHSIEPLDIASTEAGLGRPIVGVTGVNSNDDIVKDGVWDLTLNSIPLLNETGVTFEPGFSYGVEFNRDVVPILNAQCVSCHTTGGSGSMFILDGSGGQDAWSVINETGSYHLTQVSKYIRTPQARQSLLVWVAWGERLDGRGNNTRAEDIDYPDSHPALSLTDRDKRTIARWVDLGGAVDFPNTDGMGYTDDYQLPVINIYTPNRGNNASTELKVGFADAKSGLDWSTLNVSYYSLTDNIAYPVTINIATDIDTKRILSVPLSIDPSEYVITVSINDLAGNTGVESRRFILD